VPTAMDIAGAVFLLEKPMFRPKGCATLKEAESYANDVQLAARLRAPSTPLSATLRSQSMELRPAPSSSSPSSGDQASSTPRILGFSDSRGVTDSQGTEVMDEDMQDEPLQPASARKAAQPKEATKLQATVPTVTSINAQHFRDEDMQRNIAPITLGSAYSIIQDAVYSTVEETLKASKQELIITKANSAINEKRAIEAAQHAQGQANYARSLERENAQLKEKLNNKRGHDGAVKSTAPTSIRPLPAWQMPISDAAEADNTYCIAIITYLPKAHAGAGNKTDMPINIDHTDDPLAQLDAAKSIICSGPHCLLQAHSTAADRTRLSIVAARINQHKQAEPAPRTANSSSSRGRGSSRGKGRGGSSFTINTSNGIADRQRECIRVGMVLKVNDAIALQPVMREVGERVRSNTGTRLTLTYLVLRDTDTSTIAADDVDSWQSKLEEKFNELHFL
jgi:hypothetical protein